MIQPEYLDTRETGELVGLSPETLKVRRRLGSGPPFIKMGRTIRYKREDVIAWMDAQRVGGK